MSLEMQETDGEWIETRQSVLWYRLICDVNSVSELHGIGLANVWEWINKDDYVEARREFERVKADCLAGRWKLDIDNKYMKAKIQRILTQMNAVVTMLGKGTVEE